MHRLTSTIGLLALVLGCRPIPQPAVTAQSAPPDDGKIPVTTRSAAARATFLRGRALNENLQTVDARQLFQQSVALDSAFALGHYGLAATASTAKQRDAHLQTAITLVGRVSPGERLLILGLQARTHGQPERARQYADSLVAQYPGDERAHWTLGNAYAAHQQYEPAIAAFRTAITLAPKYSLAYNQLGYAYRGANQLTEAEAAFRQYIALVPNDPNPYDSYAELLMLTGRFDESIVQYRKALALDAHFAGSFVGIAANEMLAGRYDAAIAAAEHYLATARDDYQRRTALLTMAIVHVDHGATDNAIDAMERRLAFARAAGDTVNMSGDGVMIADILLEAGRVSPARERFAQAHGLLAASSAAADLKRDDALGSRFDEARVALAAGDLLSARAAAVAYAAGAAERRNDARMRQAHELSGLVALAARDFDESLAELDRADQQNPAVWFAKARAYAGRGDSARAKVMDDRAKHMNILPTFPYVFTRARLAAATHSATSQSAVERPR